MDLAIVLDGDTHRPAADGRMGVGINDSIALEGGILEHTRPILGRAPPFRGELTDLGRSLRKTRDEPAIPIDYADEPIRRYGVSAEEA
jgi:hypothetical protein